MKTAVVIGAGTIGTAIALRLGVLGYRVDIATHAEIELRDPASIARYFARHRRIDVLVNAAGSYGAVGTVRDVAPEAWREALAVNLAGVYACCHHALPLLPDGGHIIHIAGGGRGPMEMRSGYAAAKSGLWRLTETLAAEEPVLRVNAIAPGPMKTRMQDAVLNLARPWAQALRATFDAGKSVPVANTLRALNYILDRCPTGQLFFAREFGAPQEAVA